MKKPTHTLVIIGVDGSEKREALLPIGARDSSGQTQLQQLQKAVGGYIEGIKVRYEDRVRRAYANEDGISLRLPFNNAATEMYRNVRGGPLETMIHGPIAIVLPYPPEGS